MAVGVDASAEPGSNRRVKVTDPGVPSLPSAAASWTHAPVVRSQNGLSGVALQSASAVHGAADVG